MTNLSIIVPAHNEEENIGHLIERIAKEADSAYELIVVDDHSQDSTGQIVRNYSQSNKNIKLVENILEKGFANALKTGFHFAQGQALLPVMADLCDDLASIKPMLAKIDEGYDVVCASRYSKGGRREGGSRLKGFLSRMAGVSLKSFLGIPTRDIANAFKMYKRSVIDGIQTESSGFEISMEMTLKAHFLGYRIAEVPTMWQERKRGESSFKVFKLLPSYLKLYVWALMQKARR